MAVVGLALIAGAVWLTSTWFDLTSPEIQLRPEVKAAGRQTNLHPERYRCQQRSQPGKGLVAPGKYGKRNYLPKPSLAVAGAGEGSERAVELPLTVEPKAWGFKDGPAELLVEARDYSWMGWLRGNRAELVRNVTIDLTPLRLTFTSINEFLIQGGTGLVTYQVNKPMAKSGIVVNGEFFSGFPIKGGDSGRYLAFFAVPYDLPQPLTLELLAVDQGGAEARTKLLYRLKPKRWKADKINLGDDFLNKKMPEFQEMNPELKNINNPLEVFLTDQPGRAGEKRPPDSGGLQPQPAGTALAGGFYAAAEQQAHGQLCRSSQLHLSRSGDR